MQKHFKNLLLLCLLVLSFTAHKVQAQAALLKDLNLNTGSSSTQNLTILGTKQYFTATITANGQEFYEYDPAVAVSATNPKLIDIQPGTGNSTPQSVTVLATKLGLYY